LWCTPPYCASAGQYAKKLYSSKADMKKRGMKNVVFRVGVTESQAEELRKRLGALPFKITYQEEQRGASLVALITCTPSQEQIVRRTLDELQITRFFGD
jgi:hypothetical protein